MCVCVCVSVGGGCIFPSVVQKWCVCVCVCACVHACVRAFACMHDNYYTTIIRTDPLTDSLKLLKELLQDVLHAHAVEAEVAKGINKTWRPVTLWLEFALKISGVQEKNNNQKNECVNRVHELELPNTVTLTECFF